MYDFSALELTGRRNGLNAAIVCIALLAVLADLLRIHTMFASDIKLSKTAFLQKWSGSSNDDVHWEIRPLTGSRVSWTVFTVPILALALIASSETCALRKRSAINSGLIDTTHICLTHDTLALTFSFSFSDRPAILRRVQRRHPRPSHAANHIHDLFAVHVCVGCGCLPDHRARNGPHSPRHYSGVSQQWLLFRFTCRVLRMNCFWLTAHLFFQLSSSFC